MDLLAVLSRVREADLPAALRASALLLELSQGGAANGAAPAAAAPVAEERAAQAEAKPRRASKRRAKKRRAKKPSTTPAPGEAQALAELLAARVGSTSRAATTCGVTPNTYRRWLSGHAPKPAALARLRAAVEALRAEREDEGDVSGEGGDADGDEGSRPAPSPPW